MNVVEWVAVVFLVFMFSCFAQVVTTAFFKSSEVSNPGCFGSNESKYQRSIGIIYSIGIQYILLYIYSML